MTSTNLKGPKFWVVTAAISGLGTLSLVMTLLTMLLGFRGISGIPDDWLRLLNVGVFVLALASGSLGLGSLLLCGLADVGRVTFRGRLLPVYTVPLLCIPLYLGPWGIALFLWIIA